ncbi:hypothetical protein PSACC_02494 [Paramicrosporidium saccamoebae]|uniref:Uncharacterized protein n=1 Tax=Paramicrosporidium saccamoebae TaxID=1246581 RepID=A0A2H9TIW1_9FUNG|nr:hypothetical protein PSACC_02494 [Paramicrosporidium saccamoebae]
MKYRHSQRGNNIGFRAKERMKRRKWMQHIQAPLKDPSSLDCDTKETNQLDDLDREVLEFIGPSATQRPSIERRHEKVVESSNKYYVSSSINESLDEKTNKPASISADWNSEGERRSERAANWSSSLVRQESSDWEPMDRQRIWDKVCPHCFLLIQIAEHDARIEKLSDCFLNVSRAVRRLSLVDNPNAETTHKRYSQ